MSFTPRPPSTSTTPTPWELLSSVPAELLGASRWIAYLLTGEKRRKQPAASTGQAWPLASVLADWEPSRHRGAGFRCIDEPIEGTGGAFLFALDVDACLWPVAVHGDAPPGSQFNPADFVTDAHGARFLVADWCVAFLGALLLAGAWVEVTGSGEGLRVLWLTPSQSTLAGEAVVRAPGTPNKTKPGVSIYSRDKGGSRWVAINGHRVTRHDPAPAERPPLPVVDLDDVVVGFFAEHFADPRGSSPAGATAPAAGLPKRSVAPVTQFRTHEEAVAVLLGYETDPDSAKRKLFRLWEADPDTVAADPSAAHFELLGALALVIGRDEQAVRELRDAAPSGRWRFGNVPGSHDGEKYAADSWLRGELRRALAPRSLRDSERRAMLSTPIDEAELDRLVELPPPPEAVVTLAGNYAAELTAEQVAASIAAGGRVLGLRWDTLGAFVAAQCDQPPPDDETDAEREERAEHERARAQRSELVAELDRIARLARTARRFEAVANYLGESRNSPSGPFVFSQKRRARLPGFLFDDAFIGAGLLCLTARPKAGKSLFLAYAVAHMLLGVPLAGRRGFALLRTGAVPVLMIATEDGDAATARILAAVLALAEQHQIPEHDARSAFARLLLIYDAPLPGVASGDHATRNESAWQLHLHRELLRERSAGVEPVTIFDTWTRQIEEGQPDTHEKALAPNAKAFVAALTEGGRWHVMQTRHGGHDKDKCDRPRDSNESLQTVSSLWWCAKLGDTWAPVTQKRRGAATPGGPGSVTHTQPIEPIRSVLARLDGAERARAAATFSGWIATGAPGDVLLAPSAEQRHGSAAALPLFLFAVATRDVVDDDGLTIPGVPFLIARDVFVPGRRWAAEPAAAGLNAHGFTPWTEDQLPSHAEAAEPVAVATTADEPVITTPPAAPPSTAKRKTKAATTTAPPVAAAPPAESPPPHTPPAPRSKLDGPQLLSVLLNRIDSAGGEWTAPVRIVSKLLGISPASLSRFVETDWILDVERETVGVPPSHSTVWKRRP